MLYSEFLRGTGAPETTETYQQFRLVEKIYNDCEKMTKEEAFAIWKKSYGRELRAKRQRMMDRVNSLLLTRCERNKLSDRDKFKILSELDSIYWKAFLNEDQSTNPHFPERRTFVDNHGVVWGLRKVTTYLNGTVVYGLFAVIDGKVLDAHFRI